MVEHSLGPRFEESMLALGIGEEPRRLLVALSGGVDSMVLLHLLRFLPAFAHHQVIAAHLDHWMRASSAADAAWVKGLCIAWNVPLQAEVARGALSGETAARDARYQFLHRIRHETSADAILTGHHADDQAETVLFRIARGTGLYGLQGIRPRTRSGLLRPLLPFWRDEIEAYARLSRLSWREDPTNRDLGPARNFIRQVVLPVLEAEVSPGTRRNLVALSSLARENEGAWKGIVDRAIDEMARPLAGGFEIDRRALAVHPPAIGARVVRELLRRLDVVPDRVGTRSTLQFITDAPSGRERMLPRGVRIRTEFGRAFLGRPPLLEADSELSIPRVQEEDGFSGAARFGGRGWRVTLRPGPSEFAPFDPTGLRLRLRSDLAFPLVLRGRKPGDRVRTPAGTKSLKKLLIERRVPVSERFGVPVLVDASGRVLWVAGLAADREMGTGDFVLELTPE